jgi:E3 ubiquitin-protein ligase HUWE1
LITYTLFNNADHRTGFHDIIPADLISIFTEQELELLISGLPDIDVDDWKAHTEYHNYTAASQQIQWFWRAVRSFDKEERAKLLQFVTGTSKVPLNGFKELEGMNGVNRFNIHRDYGNKDRLPSSHTCFNRKFSCFLPFIRVIGSPVSDFTMYRTRSA